MRYSMYSGLLAALAIAACTSAKIEDRTTTSFYVEAKSAPACGMSDKEYMDRASAIEVIKRGGDRFVYLDSESVSRSNVVPMGGYISYQTETKRIGTVQMLGSDQPAPAHALSARRILGPEWEAVVAEGLGPTCM